MQTQSKHTYYNTLYKGIASAEDFFPIISTSTIGFTMGGYVGAGVGFVLGATDYTANYFEIYEKPYLTSAVLGAGVFSKLSLPYNTQYILGTTIGLIAPTGHLNKYLDKSFTPASTALYGYSYAGQYGAATGFAAGIADEALSSYNITQQHYFSNIIQSISTTNLLMPLLPKVVEALPLKFGIVRDPLINLVTKALSLQWTKESTGIALGTLQSYYFESDDEKLSPVMLSNKIYKEYSDILDEKDIQTLIHSRAIATVTTALITQSLVQTLADHFQNTRTALRGFENLNKDTWKTFLSTAKSTAIFLPAYVASIIVNQVINSFFCSRDVYKINDLLTAELVKDERILRLLQNTTESEADANSLIKRRYSDVTTLSSDGARALAEGLSSLTKGVFGINYLVSKNAENIVIYSMIYSSAANLLSTKISSKAGNYDTIISELSDKKTSFEEYFQKNADSSIQRDSNDFIEFKLAELTQELREVDGEQFYWSTLHNIWMTAKSITDFLFNILITAHHINTGAIQFKERTKIAFTNEEVYPMLEWSGQNAGNIIRTMQSIDSLTEFKERIRKETTRIQPNHIYKPIQNNEEWLCLDNLEVKVGNTSLIKVQHQCLTSKITSVSGESNSGKSTMLNLVKGLKETLGWGSGNITFYTETGKKPSILIASQHYNTPPYTKLLEAITLKPYQEAKLQEKFVRELMHEIKIDSDNKDNTTGLVSLLHEEKDWNQYITSGGARKKLIALWVILENPDIAILDEIFVGIDRESIKIIQNMFLKHLINTKFLIVDHEAETHNFDGFYQSNLHVHNKTLSIQHTEKTISEDPFELADAYCEPDSFILGLPKETCSLDIDLV